VVITINPTAPDERVDVVDVLRGAALFGILLVNAPWFGLPPTPDFNPGDTALAGNDALVDALVSALVEGKFYAMFSMLFGFGMAVQMGRADAAGVNFTRLFSRRLGILLVIGLLHALLLWFGDILHLYAAVGFLLLLFRNCQQRTLLVWAGALLAIPLLASTGFGLLTLAAGNLPPASQPATQSAPAMSAPAASASAPTIAVESYDVAAMFDTYFRDLHERQLAAYSKGSFRDILLQRLEDLLIMSAFSIFIVPIVLALFLAGIWAARAGILHDPQRHRGWLTRAAALGLGVGLPLNVAYACLDTASRENPDSGLPCLLIGTSFVAGPLLSVGYAAAIVLLWHTQRGRSWLTPLAAPGRTALSNYLLQSLIMTTIFYSYGFGLFGSLSIAACTALAIPVYALEVVASNLWLRRFRFGPAEWLWRSATYGKSQPFRRQ
jgi:uncharacterized protein